MTLLASSPIGTEALDTPACEAALARRTLRDITLVNTLFGGRQAAAWGLRRLLARHPERRTVRVLDVGAGAGDILTHLVRVAARRGVTVRPVALDFHRAAAALCRETGLPVVLADAAALPVRPGGVDVVLASQFLHHLHPDAAVAALRAFLTIAGLGVIVADLRRALLARVGIRVAAAVLRLHPATRHDGVVSVRRGFHRDELSGLLARAGAPAVVHRRPGFRIVAVLERTRAHR